MPEPAHRNQLNKESRLHVAAVLYFMSRIMVLIFVFGVPAIYFLLGKVELPVVIGGAILCTSLFTGYYLAASKLLCAACGSPVLMDNGNRKHPNAKRFPGINHRARVAWDILFASSYQCMYCMTRCRCKKSWGAKAGETARSSTYTAQAPAKEQTFPESIFGQVGEPLQNLQGVPAAAALDAPAEPVPEASLEETSLPGFAAARAFPNAQTVPVTLVAPPAAPPPRPAPATVPFSPAEAPAMFPAPSTLSPVFSVSASPAASSSTAPHSEPLPWTVPPAPNDTAMNAPTNDPAPAANPFLIAAATPPPVVSLPQLPPAKTLPVPLPEEFPHAPAHHSGSAPPWTIPSMPVAIPAATAPVPQQSAPSRPSAAPDVAAPLLREIVDVLTESQRSFTSALQGLIERLENRLASAPSAPVQAAIAAPAPSVSTPPISPSAPPAPPQPPRPLPEAAQGSIPGPVLPELLATSRSAPIPVPPMNHQVAMPPAERTSFVPIPALHAAAPPAPSTKPVPATPFSAPPPPGAPLFRNTEPVPEPAAPRRRFAKPSTTAAQQLNEVLKDAFAQPAPESLPPRSAPWQSDSQGAVSSITQQTTPVPVSVTPRQFAATAPHQAADSPFGISDKPLMAPATAPQAPAPFTYLNNAGEHSAPAPSADTLDSEMLPWMQPIGAHSARG